MRGKGPVVDPGHHRAAPPVVAYSPSMSKMGAKPGLLDHDVDQSVWNVHGLDYPSVGDVRLHLCAGGDGGIVARKVGEGKSGGGWWFFDPLHEKCLTKVARWRYNAGKAGTCSGCQRRAGSHGAQWMPSHTHSHIAARPLPKVSACVGRGQVSTSLGRSELVDGLCHSVVWSARVLCDGI